MWNCERVEAGGPRIGPAGEGNAFVMRSVEICFLKLKLNFF